MENFKECKTCKNNKSINEFSTHMYSKDGHYNNCKICEREKNIEPAPDPLVKTCNLCKESKSANHYRYKKNGKWGLTAQCNECISEKNKLKSLQEKPQLLNETKVCCQCNLEQPLECYTKDSYKSDGLRPECNSCKTKNRLPRRDRELEMGKIYRDNNREELNKKQKLEGYKMIQKITKDGVEIKYRERFKSQEEVLIANFLFRNNIEYKYEDSYQYKTACYQHSIIEYYGNGGFSNASLRKRFGMHDKQAAQISLLIKDTMDAGKIKAKDSENISKKFSLYVPYWA